MHGQIGHRHLPGQQEGDRPRQEPGEKGEAAEQFEKCADERQERKAAGRARSGAMARHLGKAEQLRRALQDE
jgi:hypothetical protein